MLISGLSTMMINVDINNIVDMYLVNIFIVLKEEMKNVRLGGCYAFITFTSSFDRCCYVLL
jgi:hypothetical protein